MSGAPLVALAALALAAPPPFRATLAAPTHTPKTGVRWEWSVRVTDDAGKPIRARITAQVVDPFGGVHPVERGGTTRDIVDLPFVGTFRDFAIWPRESRGFRLVFRVTLKAKGATRRLEYPVRPR